MRLQRISQEGLFFMSMFNDISWWSRGNEKECEPNVRLVSLCAKRFGTGQWSFLVFGSISADSPQGERDRITERMMLEFGENRHPVFRATTIVQRLVQKQRRWKIVDTPLCRPGHDYNCFSHNYFCKSSLAAIWRTNWKVIRILECCWNRTVFHDKRHCTILTIHRCSGTLHNSHNSQMQWPVVNTLCQETKKHLHEKVGFEETPKLGSYWKSETATCKVNMEWKSELCL